MSLWRLELLRLVRTHRWVLLVGIYAFFGVLGPLTARYMSEIVQRFGQDVVLDVPDPTPVDGIAQFLSNTTQIGLLAVIIVAAGTLAIDTRTEIAAFLRTRVEHVRQLLWPRYLTVTVAAVIALLVGTAIAWVLTLVLIGTLPVGAMLVGTAYGALYLLFAVAALAAVGAFTRTTLSTVFAGIGVLLVLPLLGMIPPVSPWLPSALVSAVTGLIEGQPATEFLRAAAVSVAAIPALLLLTAHRLERREI